MAKKQRKTTLSSLAKALAEALGISDANPATVCAKLDDFKKRGKSFLPSLGYIDTLCGDFQTEKHLDMSLLKRISQDASMGEWLTANRGAALYMWHNNKLVYEVRQETLHFINEEFPVEKLNIPMTYLMKEGCARPIYIEFPKGSVTQGAFCFCSSIPNTSFVSSPDDSTIDYPSLVIIPVGGGGKISVHRFPRFSVKDWFNKEDEEAVEDPVVREIMKALCYISYTRKFYDAEGSVFIPYARQGAECYTVHPIPFKDSLPAFDLGDDCWMGSGLCSAFGYLGRENMMREFEDKLNRSPELADYVFTDNGEPEEFIRSAMTYRAVQSVIDWEHNKRIYQYDADVESNLLSKYMDEFLLNGVPSRLISYMPYEPLLFSQKDSGILTLVSLCDIRSGGDKGLYITQIVPGEDLSLCVIPTDDPPITHSDEILRASCVAIHLLSILEKREIKKQLKEHMRANAMPTEALVPTYEPGIKNPRNKEMPRVEYTGYIEEPFVEVFDLTPRTVKRAGDYVRETSGGWKMRPHRRRRHPHRYWVGTGADRHLEVRWLDEMNINAKSHKDVKTATVMTMK